MKKFTFAEADRILKGAEQQAKGRSNELSWTIKRVLEHVKEINPAIRVAVEDFDGHADFYSWFYSFLVSDEG